MMQKYCSNRDSALAAKMKKKCNTPIKSWQIKDKTSRKVYAIKIKQ